MAGLFQSTGWPSVVSIVANWFGKGKRGLIMGIWNAHTSIGNILGTVVAAAMLSSVSCVAPCFELCSDHSHRWRHTVDRVPPSPRLHQGWGWSFAVPGLLMVLLGILIFCFLVVQPSDVGLPSPYEHARSYEQVRDEDDMVRTARGRPTSVLLNIEDRLKRMGMG